MFDAAVLHKPRCLHRNKPDWAARATPLRTNSDKSSTFNSGITGMASVLALAFFALCGCDSHPEPVNNHKNVGHPATRESQQASRQVQRAVVRGSAHLPKNVRLPVQVMILTKFLSDALSESGTAGHSSNPASEAELWKSIYPHPGPGQPPLYTGQPPLKAAGIDGLLRKPIRAIAVEPPKPGKYVLQKQMPPSQESTANANTKADKDELFMRASQAFSLFSEGKFEEAKASAQRALDLSQRIVGPDGYVTAKCHRLLHVIAAGAGDLAEAEKQLRESLRIDEGLLKQYTSVTSTAQWQAFRDKVVKATEATAQRELLKERCVPSIPELEAAPDATVVLWGIYADMADQGLTHFSKGNLEEAEQYFRRAMDVPISGHAGANNMFSACASLLLIPVLETKEKWEEIDLLLDVAEKAVRDPVGFGEHSAEAALVAAARGNRETSKGNYGAARALLQQAIAMFDDIERSCGALNGPVVGQAWFDLCVGSIANADPARAETEAQKAVELFRESLGAESAEAQVADAALADLRTWQSERTWESSNGKFTRRGRLIGVTDDAVVTIRGADETASVIPVSELSQADQAFVQQYMEHLKEQQEEQEDPFVDVSPRKKPDGE